MKDRITFVGLDVHATSIALAVLPPDTERPIEREIPNDPKLIRRTFARLKAEGPLRCCYEAGPCGFPRQLMAFLGLVPSELSSGSKERRGGITKTGNSHARRILVEAAWAYRHPPALGPRTRRLLADQPPELIAQVRKAQLRLHKRYARLVGRGKRPQVAVTAVARELCGFVWALMSREAA